MSVSKRLSHLRLGLAIPALFAAALPVSAQQIGTVASTEPTLSGTVPGGAQTTLNVGAPLVADQIVQSSPEGRAQLLFADQTTLSMGPNTTIILDRFVFDPNGGGELGLEMTQGALRFIGGTLSRDQPATITTPATTIGIRGSSTLVTVINGRAVAIFLAGEQLCITASGATSCTSRQGGVLGEDGYQGRVSDAFLAFLLGVIDGAPVSGGGGGGLGSGVNTPNPSERGPVSTTGEELDFDIFEENFTFEELTEFFEGSLGVSF